ncbi:MAG: hypothetical protein ACK54H_05445 [Phycisphaerales bacterium]|jgi:hypothetical protein
MSSEELDLIITRVVDRRATAADWSTLESFAAKDPSVWKDLGATMRIDHELRRQVDHEVRKGDNINITVERIVRHGSQKPRSGSHARRIGSWGGWIAAAVLIAFSLRGANVESRKTDTSLAGFSGSTREILSNYLQSGKRDGSVVGEMPEKVLLNTTPAEDGGTYVIFIRQIVEKVKVEDLYRISTDETGRPTPVRIPESTSTYRGPAM